MLLCFTPMLLAFFQSSNKPEGDVDFWIACALLFILNYLFIFLFLRKQKQLTYFISALILMIGWGVWCFSFGRPPLPPGVVEPEGALPPPEMKRFRILSPEMGKFFIGMLLVSISVGYETWKKMKKEKEKKEALEKEKLKMQLDSIRMRINPHFFMNTMNNIQSLVLTDQAKAVQVIEDFSNMMRMVLYMGEYEVIPLTEEIELMKCYISLMRIRYDDEKVIINSSFPEDVGDAFIQPMIITTLLENAFKYGILPGKRSVISIVIKCSDDRIICECENSFGKRESIQGLGLGLQSVKKMLELVYGKDFTLSTEEVNQQYKIRLSIPSNIKATTI